MIQNNLWDFKATQDPFAQSNLFGKAVRLGFHDAGEIDLNSNDTLGPDGCLSNTMDNAGLIEDDSLVNTYIEPLWQSVCNRISRADFWALFATTVVEISEPTDSISLEYYYGRTDNAHCEVPWLRLPMAQSVLDELQRVFVNQMGLTLADAVTLLGAHTLGHVHPSISGYGYTDPTLDYVGNYSVNGFDQTPHLFDNNYFKILLQLPWRSHTPVNRSDISFWTVLFGKQIFLPVDIALAFPLNLDVDPITGFRIGKIGEICRTSAAALLTDGEEFDETAFSVQCSNTGINDNTINTVFVGGYTFTPTPIARTDPPETEPECELYALGNDDFINAFAEVFPRMLSVGYDVFGIKEVGSKLGMLYPYDSNMCGGGGGGTDDYYGGSDDDGGNGSDDDMGR